MKPKLKLVEARGDDITFTFGRFNPPTVGHEKLINATQRAATKDYRVYASHSQDDKKNPLDYDNKVKWMKKMFSTHKSKIQSGGDYRTALDVAVKLYDEGFLNLTMVVGSDRVREFRTLKKAFGLDAEHDKWKICDFKHMHKPSGNVSISLWAQKQEFDNYVLWDWVNNPKYTKNNKRHKNKSMKLMVRKLLLAQVMN